MAVYRLPAVKNMTLSRQRIHGLIPLSDHSLTHLYPTCLLRKDSLHLYFPLSKTFILSLCYSSRSPPVPFAAFLNDFPVIVSNPPLCLCQCVHLYYNGVPAVDKCRHEKKEVKPLIDLLGYPSLTSLAPLIPHLQSISDP